VVSATGGLGERLARLCDVQGQSRTVRSVTQQPELAPLQSMGQPMSTVGTPPGSGLQGAGSSSAYALSQRYRG
jgi:hypothetical protein